MGNSRVKIVAVGLGNRTCKYLQYVADHPEFAELVAIADTDSSRFPKVMEKFGLPENCCFESLDSLIGSGAEADACIIGTPDTCHHEMALKAMRAGWHVLLEKPMAQNLAECQDIVRVSQETGKLVSICYVLRYHPYFIKLKELSHSPSTGRILSVRQTERVGKDRTTHTFVRGPWNLKEMNTTVFFTKCCHDVDFVLWIIGEDIRSVRSVRGSKMFEDKDAPADSAERCINCTIENDCQYSAFDLYYRRRDWVKGFSSHPGETQDDTIKRILETSRYGRCVYRCPDNGVVEFQKVTFETSDCVKADITMECNTDESERITVIECQNAVISGNERTIEVSYKDGTPSESYDFTWTKSMKLHAGADMLIIREFIDAIRYGNLATRSTCASALKSHEICFNAELQ